MTIEWSVALDDKVTAPAHSAATAMGHAADMAKGLQGQMGGLHGALGHASGGMHELHEHTEGLIGAWEVFEGSLAARVVEGAFEAIVESGKELIATAIEASERVTHLTEVFGALSGVGEEGAGAMGKAIFGMTRQLAKELPQSEATIQSWTRSLMGAGVTDMGRLQESLRATASAESLVEGAGEKVRGMLAKLNEASVKGTKIRFSMAQLAGTGVTEQELLKQLGMTAGQFEMAKKHGTLLGTKVADAMTAVLAEKGSGPLAGQMSELSTVVTKGKDAFMRLLEGVNPKPLIDGMKTFFSVFDDANPSGKVMRDMIVGGLDMILRVSGKVFEFLKNAFLHLMIWGLQVAIWLKPIIRDFGLWFEKVHGAQILITALKGVGIVLGVLAAAGLAVVAVGASIAAVFAAAGVAVVGAVAWIVGMVPKAGEALGDLAFKAAEAGKNFILGLVNGIKGGLGAVVDAVKGVATAGWHAITNVWESHSPSQLGHRIGLSLPQGVAGGIEAGTPDVQNAAGGMSAAAVPRAGGGGGSVTVTIGDIVVHVDGTHAKHADEIGHAVADVVEEKLASLMNRLSNMGGTAPVPT